MTVNSFHYSTHIRSLFTYPCVLGIQWKLQIFREECFILVFPNTNFIHMQSETQVQTNYQVSQLDQSYLRIVLQHKLQLGDIIMQLEMLFPSFYKNCQHFICIAIIQFVQIIFQPIHYDLFQYQLVICEALPQM
ncbi:Hypothetical_protein [Hexamita inflata]|uniref:Hypothetical_protein n=1 Tax=Hexamita inflata TaxID=28002 RepID=A0AA86PZV8_9EUKA|nr:Hypothetical protein HINF_LOCUS37160 [Hexamita inflata]